MLPRRFIIILEAFLPLTLSACAATGVAGHRAPTVPLNYKRIPASEIRGAATAYDALMQLRPLLSGWRATLLAQGPVYLDDEPIAAPTLLRTAAGGAVREIRFLHALEATSRFGTGHPRGAIVVITKPGA